MRQAALAVALGRILLKALGETAGNGQGFLLVTNNVGRSLNPRHWRGDPNSLIRRGGGLRGGLTHIFSLACFAISMRGGAA